MTTTNQIIEKLYYVDLNNEFNIYVSIKSFKHIVNDLRGFWVNTNGKQYLTICNHKIIPSKYLYENECYFANEKEFENILYNKQFSDEIDIIINE